MNKKIRTILLALAVCLALPDSSLAEIAVLEVTGVVDRIYTKGRFALDGSVSIGSAMTGSCIYDTDAPDQDAHEGIGLYRMISISMSGGNYTFTDNPLSSKRPSFRVRFAVDPGYDITSDASRFEGIIYVNGAPQTYEDLIWGGTHLELFNLLTSSYDYILTDALPGLDWIPDLSVFDYRRGSDVSFGESYYVEDRGYSHIHGEVTSLRVIPEPGTVLLLALGGLCLLTRRRT